MTNLSNSSLNNSLTFFISNCLISNSTEIFPKIKQLKNAQYWRCDQPKELLFKQFFKIFYKELPYKQQYWYFSKNEATGNAQYWRCDQPKQLLFKQLFNIFYK